MKKLLLVLMLGIAAFAQTINIGDKLPTITLQDQFEKTHTVSSQSKTILVAFDKDASDVIKEFLLEKDGNFLTENQTVYIGDISGMPSLISRFFAIPKADRSKSCQ